MLVVVHCARYNELMVTKVVFAVSLAVLSFGAFLVSAELAYAEQLPPGITIAGQSFTGQNRTALKASLQSLFNQYNATPVTLALGTKTIRTSFTEAGIQPNLDAMVTAAFNLSHSTIPGEGTLRTLAAVMTKKNDIPFTVTLDPAQNRTFLDETVHASLGTPAEDASLNIGDTTVEIVPGASGTWIEDTELMNRLTLALTHHADQVVVPSSVQKPEVTMSDLALAKSETESLLNRSISLVANNKTFAISRSDLASWIFVQADQGQYHAKVDATKIKTYLSNTVASKVNQKTETQLADKNGNVTLTGKDGASLLIDDSVSKVVDAFAKPGDSSTINLAVEVKNKPTVVVDPQLGCDASKTPGKYIEINLSLQKMCLYDGGTFVNTFRVSTGKWSTPTPEGTFAIQNKIEVAYSARYGLYMPLWKAITPDGAYGIHGLPYKGNWVEGQGHIGTPVSHGCIRLGPGDDATVHNWVDIGDPVFIHQ